MHLSLSGGPEPLRGTLAAEAATRTGSSTFPHRATTGTHGALSWGAGGAPNGLARDIRPDESGVPTYTSPPLDTPLEILGLASAELAVSTSMTVATLVVRLSDVAPDGTSSQVTVGILNLTHRESHANPEPLNPGERTSVAVPMRAAGYRFAVGHRIRLSIASSCWPVIWPSPEPGWLTIHHGPAAGEAGAAIHTGSRLVLPLAPGVDDAQVPTFKTSPPDMDVVGAGSEDVARWQVIDDVLAGTVTVLTHDGGATVLETGARLYTAESHEMRASDADPARASMASAIRYVLERDGHRIEIDVDGDTTSNARAFDLDIRLVVRLDGTLFFERRTNRTIPRDLG
jgi:hypothetical protein